MAALHVAHICQFNLRDRAIGCRSMQILRSLPHIAEHFSDELITLSKRDANLRKLSISSLWRSLTKGMNSKADHSQHEVFNVPRATGLFHPMVYRSPSLHLSAIPRRFQDSKWILKSVVIVSGHSSLQNDEG
ncbi:hypothetical protein TIFTF001_025273 [Ficus carica]|uniref:Uncharacterized protein n=1 Tax=Ficus carica TaxID=3494 RepID=A0AA88DGJ0_FICCA|nr:hypothetical protein TIFTF001_025273 [Ficus carica]